MTKSNQKPVILIVDDDDSVLVSLSLLCKQADYETLTAKNPQEALRCLQQHNVDLVLQDMNFTRQTSGREGMQLLHSLRNSHPALPVILMTAWGSIELAVEGMKHGASDFVTKPWDNRQLLNSVAIALDLADRKEEQLQDREALDAAYDFSDILGTTPTMINVLNAVARIAHTNAPVLILGESGTGKEVIADAIHRNSQRKLGPMVKVNLGAIPHSLFESEMFGHVKGAFTDAKQDRLGRFASADQGTLFLDEVAELDRSQQVKLLRVLQDQSYQPVGSSETQRCDIRVISATNRDMKEMVAQQQFREDLLYRLNLITLSLPPLRERSDDIPLIAMHHVRHMGAQYGRGDMRIADAALSWLSGLPWPGNVRQLKHTIERALLMTDKPQLGIKDFVDPELAPSIAEGQTVPRSGLTLDEMEKMMVEQSLADHQGNISKTAESLGISRAALYRRLEKHQIKL